MAPVLVEAAHSDAPEHANLRSKLQERVQLQKELLRLWSQLEARAPGRTPREIAGQQQSDEAPSAQQVARFGQILMREGDGAAGSPESLSLPELAKQVARRELELEMQQLMARELVLLHDDWVDGPKHDIVADPQAPLDPNAALPVNMPSWF